MYAEVDSRTRAAVWLRAALAIDYKCVDALQVSAAYVTVVYVTLVYVTLVFTSAHCAWSLLVSLAQSLSSCSVCDCRILCSAVADVKHFCCYQCS
jgi:hypothetical protein